MIVDTRRHFDASNHPCYNMLTTPTMLAALLQGNAVIVDIRSVREKEAGGMPDIPNTSKWRAHDAAQARRPS